MSTKEDGLKDKKTKKKKTTKSAEGKTKENEKELAVNEDGSKERNEGKHADKQDKTSDSIEKNIEGKPHISEEGTIDDMLKEQVNADPSSSQEQLIAESVKEEVKPVNVEDRGGSKKKEKEIIKSTDLEKLIELKEAFSLFDFNHDGIIDLQDLKYTFASLGKPDFPEEEMQKMLKEAKEPVNFDAFVSLFGYKVSTLDPEDVFTKALATWDMRGVGMIPEDSLKKDIQCFGDKFTGKETKSALEEAPVYITEGMSMIDYMKFSNNICGFRNVERTRQYQKEVGDAEQK